MSSEDAFDIDEAIAAKPITPFSHLPPSTFNIDESKKKFFEMKKNGENYFDTLFETEFDSAGYSVFHFDYKYNNEFIGKPDFVTSNIINGYKQQIPMNRFIFGTLNLVESPGIPDENDPSFLSDGSIGLQGVFIIRGDTVTAELLDPLNDYCTWTKLELNKETIPLISQQFYSDTNILGAMLKERVLCV